MKHAKKLVAVLIAMVMVVSLSAMAFAAGGEVKYVVSDGKKAGEKQVAVVFSGLTNLCSWTINCKYPSTAEPTKCGNGADAKAVVNNDIDNAANAAFNPTFEPGVASLGGNFMHMLWDADKWADEDGEDINADNFEYQIITFKVSGEDKIEVTFTASLVIDQDGDEDTKDEQTVELTKTVVLQEGKEPASEPVSEPASESEPASQGGSVNPNPSEKPSEGTSVKPSEQPTEKVPPKTTEKPTEKPTEAPSVAPVIVYKAEAGAKDKNGNLILGYDKNGNAVINGADGKKTLSPDETAKKDPAKLTPVSTDESTTKKTTPGKTDPGKTTDKGPHTGDNSVLAVMAGVIALAGAAFVVTKKRK